VNGDNVLDLADAIISLQIVAGINPGQSIYKSADVNGDEAIGLEEVIYILEEVVGARE
jgi:hypothetical protein